MIGKIVKGSGFKGCVMYVMGKQDAKLLASDGVLDDSAKSVINSFYTQTRMNPNIKKPVGHISLSYSKEDSDKLTDDKMVELAKEYMQKMGIKDTQYIIVRHHDTDHPHVHLVFNRIDNKGKTISDKNDRYRNEKVCKELKEKHGLYFSQGKEAVNIDRLRDRDKTKYEVYYAVKDCLKQSKNWNDLQKALRTKGVELQFKYKGQTDLAQGVSFTKDSLTFKGSEVDRSFSFSKLNEQLSGTGNSQSFSNNIANERKESLATTQNQSGIVSLIGGLFDLTTNPNPDNEEFNPFKKKKKKKGIRR